MFLFIFLTMQKNQVCSHEERKPHQHIVIQSPLICFVCFAGCSDVRTSFMNRLLSPFYDVRLTIWHLARSSAAIFYKIFTEIWNNPVKFNSWVKETKNNFSLRDKPDKRSIWGKLDNLSEWRRDYREQAGAELGRAQVKLGFFELQFYLCQHQL